MLVAEKCSVCTGGWYGVKRGLLAGWLIAMADGAESRVRESFLDRGLTL